MEADWEGAAAGEDLVVTALQAAMGVPAEVAALVGTT